MSVRVPILTLHLPAVLLACGCAAEPDLSRVPRLTLSVKRTIPHKGERRFTEGLVFHKGCLYEGTGLVGGTALKKIDPASGEVVAHKDMDALLPAESYFGEGITIFDGTLWQLSYRAGRALRFSLGFVKQSAEHRYEGEGWGLTHDGARLVSSDGSASLSFRDPATYAAVRTLEVAVDGVPVDRINELEYARGLIWANRFPERYILAIHPGSGEVVGFLDASALSCSRMAEEQNVLNGVAFDESRGLFYLTGKNCAEIHEVEIR